jgi:hypothetical protein
MTSLFVPCPLIVPRFVPLLGQGRCSWGALSRVKLGASNSLLSSSPSKHGKQSAVFLSETMALLFMPGFKCA